LQEGAAVRLVLLFLILAFGQTAEAYVYVSYNVPDAITDGVSKYRLEIDKKQSISGHSIEVLDVCDEPSAYHCFIDGAIAFSVPREGLDVGLEWKYFRSECRALRKESMSVLGQNIPVFVISCSGPGSRVAVFYFSKKRGLMAFKISRESSSDDFDFYVLEGKQGFPY
jgi:hypothetical protein